jgi:hypothetical protein
MPITLTNLTGSRVNVPCSAGEQPKHVLAPGVSVEISDEYLTSLDGDAQARFLRVTNGSDPIFKVSVPSVVEPMFDVLTRQEKDLLALGHNLSAPEDPVEPQAIAKGKKGRK